MYTDVIQTSIILLAKKKITGLFLSYMTHTYVICQLGGLYGKKLWPRSWKCYLWPHEGTVMNSEIWLALYVVRVSLSLLTDMVKRTRVICPFVYKVLKKVFKSFLFLYSNNNNDNNYNNKGLLLTFLLHE